MKWHKLTGQASLDLLHKVFFFFFFLSLCSLCLATHCPCLTSRWHPPKRNPSLNMPMRIAFCHTKSQLSRARNNYGSVTTFYDGSLSLRRVSSAIGNSQQSLPYHFVDFLVYLNP